MRSTVALSLAFCALVAGTAPVRAAELTVAPSARLELSYNNNLRSELDNELESFRYGSRGEVVITRRSETDELTFTPFVRREAFSTDTIDPNIDYGVTLGGNRRFETTNVSGSFNYLRDQGQSFLDTETGDFFPARIRRNLSFGGGVARILDEKTLLSLSGGFADTSFFAGPPGQNSTGYRFASMRLGGRHQLLPRLALTLETNITRFATKDDSNTALTRNVQAGLEASLSEAWTLSAKGGPTFSDVDFIGPLLIPVPPFLVIAPQKSTESGIVYDVTATYERPRFTGVFTGGRNISPSAQGAQAIAERFSARGEYALTEHQQLRLELSRSQFASEGGLLAQNDRILKVIDLGWRWTLDPEWVLGASARRLSQRFDRDFGRVRRSSLFGLTLEYRPERWSL